MATMMMRGFSCNVLYVDPSASGANTGATPADALTALPSLATLVTNTVYLIRRGATLTVTAGTCAVANVHLMGMPKSTGDAFYGMVPAEAKTAWDGDAGDYWNATGSATTAWSFTGNDASIHRLNLTFPAAHSTVAAISATGARFSFTCIYARQSGFNVQTATAITGAFRHGTFYFNSDSVYISDIDMQMAWDSGTTSTTNGANLYAIQCDGNCQRAVIRNVLLWYLSTGYVTNRGGIIISNCDNIRMENITTRMVLNKVRGDVYHYLNPAVTCRGSGWGSNAVIRNIDHKLDHHLGATAGVSGISISAQLEFSINGGLVENLTCDQLLETGGFYGIFVGSYMGNTYIFDGNVQRAVVRNINSYKNLSVVDGAYATSFRLNAKCIAETINASAGPSSFAIDNPSDGSYFGSSVSFKGLTLTGGVRIYFASYVEILSLTLLAPRVNGIVIQGGILAYIQTLICQGTWTTESIMSVVNRSCVIVDSINIPFVATIDNNGFSQMCVNNSAGVSGQWYSESFSYRGFTSNVFRTGGASAAVKMECKAANAPPATNRYGIWMAPPPLPGKPIAPGATGLRKFTMYVAYKNFTTFDPSQMRLFIEAPAGAGTDTTAYDSVSVGTWEDDTVSTWNNDTGLTLKKLTMTLPVDRNENCRVRFHHTWWQNLSYYYVDPKITVEAG